MNSFLSIYLFYFILSLFTSAILEVVKIGGPIAGPSVGPVHGPGPQRGPCFVLSRTKGNLHAFMLTKVDFDCAIIFSATKIY